MDTENDQQEEETFNSPESNGELFVLLEAFYANLLKLAGHWLHTDPVKS